MCIHRMHHNIYADFKTRRYPCARTCIHVYTYTHTHMNSFIHNIDAYLITSTIHTQAHTHLNALNISMRASTYVCVSTHIYFGTYHAKLYTYIHIFIHLYK